MAGEIAALRLDKFLYFTRFAKSRSKANDLIVAGRPRVDGHPVASVHSGVAIGNVISFTLHDHIRIIRITALPVRRGPPAEARACFDDLSPAQEIDAATD